MKKEFILGLEECLTAENITLSFDGDNDVTIPMAVLELLFVYKGEEEKKVLASKLVDYIKSFPYDRLSTNGCKQKNGSILRVCENGSISGILKEKANISNITRRIFQLCFDRAKAAKGSEVILISQSPAIGIQAATLHIKCQPLKERIFPPLAEQYSGRYEGYTSQTEMDKFFQDGFISKESVLGYESVDWQENMFVQLTSEKNNSLIGRYTGGRIVKLQYQQATSFKPKNNEQRYLLEALEAPPEQVPLVIVKGEAGTGKTYGSLSVALNHLAGYSDDKTYVQILVAAPTVTIDEDLGYLPGEINDKVGPYLGGVKDNLTMYFRNRNEELDNRKLEFNVQTLFEQKLISIQPIGFLRGRSIQKSMFIIDECQNIKPSILRDIVTRVGLGTKLVLLGDPSQVNKPGLNPSKNGLVFVSEKFKGNSLCYQVTLNADKSLRSELAKQAIKVL